MRRGCLIITVLLACSIPALANAQVPSSSAPYAMRATVLEVLSDIAQDPPGTYPQEYLETVRVRITSGPETGSVVEFTQTDMQGDGEDLNVGDPIYITNIAQTTGATSTPEYVATDHYRVPVVIFFIALFAACIVLLGGKQGIRGLVSLCAGICFIAFLFLPGVIHGYSPVLLAIVVASFVSGVGAYITHGFSKMTTSAVIGMVLSILIAALLAQAAVHFGYLSGVTDENTYNLLSDPAFDFINFQALLFGGIIIGLSGVVYDAAISQAVAVDELSRAVEGLSRAVVYRRALRIGREHIGALVNTLVLAYVGTQLPTLLTMYQAGFYGQGWGPVLNWEFLATEIIRTSVGAIGLILTIPVTTLIAIIMLMPKGNRTV